MKDIYLNFRYFLGLLVTLSITDTLAIQKKDVQKDIQKDMEILQKSAIQKHNIQGVRHWDIEEYGNAVKEFEKVIELEKTMGKKVQLANFSNLALAKYLARDNQGAHNLYKQFLPLTVEGLQELLESKDQAFDSKGQLIDTKKVIYDAYYKAGLNSFSLEDKDYVDTISFFSACSILEKSFNLPKNPDISLYIAASFYHSTQPEKYLNATKYFEEYFQNKSIADNLAIGEMALDAAFKSNNIDQFLKWYQPIRDTRLLTKVISEEPEVFVFLSREAATFYYQREEYENAFKSYDVFVPYIQYEANQCDFFNAAMMGCLSKQLSKEDVRKAIKYSNLSQELINEKLVKNEDLPSEEIDKYKKILESLENTISVLNDKLADIS